MSLSPISWADIGAWAALTGARPRLWELGALRLLDTDYLKFVADASANGGKPLAAATPQNLRDGFRALGAKRRPQRK